MLGCLSLGAFCLRQVAYGAQGSSICSDPQAVVTESPRGVSVDSEAGWGRDRQGPHPGAFGWEDAQNPGLQEALLCLQSCCGVWEPLYYHKELALVTIVPSHALFGSPT